MYILCHTVRSRVDATCKVQYGINHGGDAWMEIEIDIRQGR